MAKIILDFWKTLAIVLLLVVIVETGLLIWFYNLGVEVTYNENECFYNICNGDEELGVSFLYDSYEKMCYCFRNGEVIKQELIK